MSFRFQSGQNEWGGPWQTASRWWRGQAPEWDLVAESRNGKRVLLGEARWSARALGPRELKQMLDALAKKSPPDIAAIGSKEVVRALFVSGVTSRGEAGAREVGIVVTPADLLG